MKGRNVNFLLILALLTYLVRWIGIRFMDSAAILDMAPLQYGFLVLLLLYDTRREPKQMLWMLGVAALGYALLFVSIAMGKSVFSPATGPQLYRIPLAAVCYSILVGTGMASLMMLGQLARWQRIAGTVLLMVAFAGLLAPAIPVLEYGPGIQKRNALAYYSGFALFGAVAAGSWNLLRLRSSHFAIALLLLEVIFLALMRL